MGLLLTTLVWIIGRITPCLHLKILIWLSISSNDIKIILTLKTAKENVAAFAVSLFRQFLYDVRKDVWELKNNKVVGGEIPVYLLEGSKFTFDTLTNFINKSIERGCFPDSLKESNFTPIFEKEYPLDKYIIIGLLAFYLYIQRIIKY